jgi:hypothetical protein
VMHGKKQIMMKREKRIRTKREENYTLILFSRCEMGDVALLKKKDNEKQINNQQRGFTKTQTNTLTTTKIQRIKQKRYTLFFIKRRTQQ